jgi:hypothetical protein
MQLSTFRQSDRMRLARHARHPVLIDRCEDRIRLTGLCHDDSAVSERKVAAIIGRKLAAAFPTPSTMQAGLSTSP